MTMQEKIQLKELINKLIENEEKKKKALVFNFSKKELKTMPKLKDFTIRKKDKYYEIRYRKNGISKSFSSTNYKIAKEKAFEWLRNFELQNCSLCAITQTNNKETINKTKFIDFATSYLYNIKIKRVKENTFKSYINTFKNHIEPTYKNFFINDIKPFFIQQHLDRINSNFPRKCEDIKFLLNNIFDYAVANEIITKNPIKAIYIPKHIRKNGQAFTKEEELNFINSIRNSKYEFVYLKMLYSGVRPCEINSIKENIKDNTLTVTNGKLKSYQKIKERILPIFPKYKTTLKNTIKKVNIIKLEQDFKNYSKEHSLKDLRHTFTTRARECKIDNEIVALWTGHSLGNITANVYTHFSIEYQQIIAKNFIY